MAAPFLPSHYIHSLQDENWKMFGCFEFSFLFQSAQFFRPSLYCTLADREADSWFYLNRSIAKIYGIVFHLPQRWKKRLRIMPQSIKINRTRKTSSFWKSEFLLNGFLPNALTTKSWIIKPLTFRWLNTCCTEVDGFCLKQCIGVIRRSYDELITGERKEVFEQRRLRGGIQDW